VDIALGVSMTPTAVRIVLVEGENADGVTVDHDVFDIASDPSSATAPEQVVAAILGTRESAAEGGHRLTATGVAWRSHDDAARLREALAAQHIDDVMLVSELHAASALAQVAGRAVGYRRTALMFLDGDTATLAVVDTADGSITHVERQDLHTEDAPARLTGMVSALEDLTEPPQGVFVVGSGLSVSALKLQLESATSLSVSAPDEAGLALARGAALAGAGAPKFEAATVAAGHAQDGDDGTTAGAVALAYSQEGPDPEDLALADAPITVEPVPVPVTPSARKPLLLVGSAMTALFVVGVAALVVSLAVSIRPTVDQRPNPAESAIVATHTPAPVAAVPPPPAAPPAPPETIPAPVPVVQEAPEPQAPRTVFVEAPVQPAPAAVPEPAAAPGPAPAPAAPVVPAAPAPVVTPAPAAPPVVAPVIPAPVLVPQLPAFRWPWEQQTVPQQQWPRQQTTPKQTAPQQQWPQQQWPQQQSPGQQSPAQQWPGQQIPPLQSPSQQNAPQWDPPKQSTPQWDPPKQQETPRQQWPGTGSRGPNGGSPGGGNPLWPWNWGN